MPTQVKNPSHRQGYPAFKTCSYCQQQFTSLGLSRHWEHCKSKPGADFTAIEKRIQGVKPGELLVIGSGTNTGRMTMNVPKPRPQAQGPCDVVMRYDYSQLKLTDDKIGKL